MLSNLVGTRATAVAVVALRIANASPTSAALGVAVAYVAARVSRRVNQTRS